MFLPPVFPRKSVTIISAVLFSVIAIYLGYAALGIIPAFIFTFGYAGGFLIWLFVEKEVSFKRIAAPYFVTLSLFVVHKIEERKMDFFPALSELTGVPVPEATSWQALSLYTIAFAWLLIPLLIYKRFLFGYYLAWTFFASMGITELAHFVFPFFRDESYGYFPGMWSVILLAPAAWWGMYKLITAQK